MLTVGGGLLIGTRTGALSGDRDVRIPRERPDLG